MISLNLQRRHLTSDQRAAIAVEFLEHYKVAAKDRQKRKSVREKIPEQNKGKAAEQAAKDFHTNEKYVKDLVKIKEEDPDVFEKIKAGEEKLAKTKKRKKQQAREQAQAEATAVPSTRPSVEPVCLLVRITPSNHGDRARKRAWR